MLFTQSIYTGWGKKGIQTVSRNIGLSNMNYFQIGLLLKQDGFWSFL